MVKVTVYFKKERIGMCGLMRNYAEYVLGLSDINLLKDDCIDLMEDFDNGRDDAYHIIFKENDISILEVLNIENTWYRYDKGVLIAKGKKDKIFEEVYNESRK